MSMSTSAGAWNRDLLTKTLKPEKIVNEKVHSMDVYVDCRFEKTANDLQTIEPCYNFTS